MKDKKPFILETYVETLAWKAFQRSKDPAKDREDFMQDAQIAILKAVRHWNIDGASVDTYCITAVVNTLRKSINKERRRHNLYQNEVRDEIGKSIVLEGSYRLDYFYIKVLDVLQSKGNMRAKNLIEVFLSKCDDLQNCSMKQLRDISGMSSSDFKLALAELSQF